MGMMTFFRRQKQANALAVVPTGGQDMRRVFEAHQLRTLVAPGMRIEGNVTSHAGAILDGEVVGNVTITAPNAALLLRESACVEGAVAAPIVAVSGIVRGSITARFVRLYPTARVEGTISAGRLIVDEGATLLTQSVSSGEPATEAPPAAKPAAPFPAPSWASGLPSDGVRPPRFVPAQRREGAEA